jgi:outer membrane protein insertion porin family
VVEVAPLFPVRFEDLGPPQQFEELLKRTDPLFGPRIPATQQILDRYARAIEEFLAASNRKEKVAGKVSAEPGEEPAVVFRPAASPPVVALVRFTSNEVIPATTLQNKMNAVAVGIPYKEARFRQLLDTSIRPLYEARGRIRVSFPQIQTEKAKDVNGLLVTVKVEEGPSYTVGEVRLDSPLVPPEELKKAGDIRSGDLANFEQILAGVARMEQRYRREGYMRVGSRLDRTLHDDRKTVDLAIHFDPGPQYAFGKLTIEGLDIHAEAAVRKLWALKEGARFNADYPDYFLERIREDSLFENLGKTRAVLDQNDEARTVEVKLVFGAAPPAPRERPRREPD